MVRGCGSGWSRRVHGYFSIAARTAAVRSSPVVAAPRISVLVTIRYDWALPSKPSGRPRRWRASRSSTRSPRCPNGGWPRSWASAAASTTSGSQPPSLSSRSRHRSSAVNRSATARATWATLRLWVSRLCTSSPEPTGLITWVTPPRRAKNGEPTIRSRSARNGLAVRSPRARALPPKSRRARGSAADSMIATLAQARRDRRRSPRPGAAVRPRPGRARRQRRARPAECRRTRSLKADRVEGGSRS